MALVSNPCDATMHHMKRASVRDLRYHFPEVERLLQQGENIEITKRKRVIARLSPARPASSRRRPDFLARLRLIYGDRILKVSSAQLLAQERDRF
jgi:antitoxin (DNA-binding transcriptional repressor) of toxin-antitoxin stability system